MNQKSPLLNYRTMCQQDDNIADNIAYNYTSGLWQDEYGRPIIAKYITNDDFKNIGQTIETNTREGIDRAEHSNWDLVDRTSITETRESADRADVSYNLANISDAFSETLITRSREGVDRSERANTPCEEVIIFQTIQSFTREASDRSERV